MKFIEFYFYDKLEINIKIKNHIQRCGRQSRSLDIEKEMAQAIDNTNSCDCTTNDSQDTNCQIIERSILLFIHDVDGLYFGVEINLLVGLVA